VNEYSVVSSTTRSTQNTYAKRVLSHICDLAGERNDLSLFHYVVSGIELRKYAVSHQNHVMD
jgi:hypothetical protein